ncbi:hypothetical protein QYZ45_27250 [Vibrio parahaemolyticus]|nr:hypothetical protein [Vibrio parahaemolyticus]
MSEMIHYQLFEVMMTALSQLYLLTFYHAGILSFLAGLITPTIYFDKPEKTKKAQFFDAFLSLSLWCCFALAHSPTSLFRQ